MIFFVEMTVTTGAERHMSFMKQSPDSSTSFVAEPFTYQSQNTDVKTRRAVFVDGDSSKVLWIGYSQGRCLAQWRRREEGDAASGEPFQETARMKLTDDPHEICSLTSCRYAVSQGNGDVMLVNVAGEAIQEVKRHTNIHGKSDDARSMTVSEKTIYSGSSSGSILTLDAESGKSTKIDSGFAGVLSISSLAGGSLFATGHSTGQLLVWDTRDSSARPSVVTPSKLKLDAITALATHPAQANLLVFGTDAGTVCFCDVRAPGAELIPSSFYMASSTITQVRFHPQYSDHLICSSADGSLTHWDASHVNSANYSRITASSRVSPWLAEHLENTVQPHSLRNKSFSSINGFDVVGDSVVAASDIMSLISIDRIPFSMTGTTL